MMVDDRDKNLSRILDQQVNIKRVIDRDCRIKSLKTTIIEDNRIVGQLRRSCTTMGLDAVKEQQELLAHQAKELERFQMQQIKSISDDKDRLEDILKQRKKEIAALKKETENEISGREAYLADVERNLERQLQNRQQTQGTAGDGVLRSRASGSGGVTDELDNPNHIELTSVDEYAPYGAAPHSRNVARGRRGRKTQRS